MKINGMVAEHIGLVGFVAPWENFDEYALYDDIWGTPDGKRYVERYVFPEIVEYDWKRHGFIWTNKEIASHSHPTEYSSSSNIVEYAEPFCYEFDESYEND